jgi:hypothetical protein
MNTQHKRVKIHGSKKVAIAGAKAVGPVPDDEHFEVTVRRKPKNPFFYLSMSSSFKDTLPQDRTYLSRDELAF